MRFGFVWRVAAVLSAASLAAWASGGEWTLTFDLASLDAGDVLEIEASSSATTATLALLLIGTWFASRLIRFLADAPSRISAFRRTRRRERFARATREGLVAVASGDSATASRRLASANRFAESDFAPLLLLLRAQEAQTRGDRDAMRRAFVEMLGAEETRLLGRRGLFHEALSRGDEESARRHAESAFALRSDLEWAGRAALESATRRGDWRRAEGIVASRRRVGDSETLRRQHAAILAALSESLGESDAAFDAAERAHRLDESLSAAAVRAARLAAARGRMRRARRILERTWRALPHPDVAEACRVLRPGESTSERMRRLRRLVSRAPSCEEGALACARAERERREWDAARSALAPYLGDSATPPSRRVCLEMAAIERGEGIESQRAVEWERRAERGRAPPRWIADDGATSTRWLAASPRTGEPGVFEWREPDDDDTMSAAEADSEGVSRGESQ